MKTLDENRLEAFEKKAVRQIFRVSWMARKTNLWVLETGRCQQKFTSKCEKWEVETNLLKRVLTDLARQ